MNKTNYTINHAVLTLEADINYNEYNTWRTFQFVSFIEDIKNVGKVF